MAIHVYKKIMNIYKVMGCDDVMNSLESYAVGVSVYITFFTAPRARA